jgi:hypothetical protein
MNPITKLLREQKEEFEKKLEYLKNDKVCAFCFDTKYMTVSNVPSMKGLGKRRPCVWCRDGKDKMPEDSLVVRNESVDKYNALLDLLDWHTTAQQQLIALPAFGHADNLYTNACVKTLQTQITLPRRGEERPMMSPTLDMSRFEMKSKRKPDAVYEQKRLMLPEFLTLINSQVKKPYKPLTEMQLKCRMMDAGYRTAQSWYDLLALLKQSSKPGALWGYEMKKK